MEGSRQVTCNMKNVEDKVINKGKDFVSQTLGAIVSRLKAIENIMGILSSYISSAFPPLDS